MPVVMVATGRSVAVFSDGLIVIDSRGLADPAQAVGPGPAK